MKVCVYQGSFNPIHNAHIEMAKYVYSKLEFDKIVFIPAFIPPHKNSKDFDYNNAIHRLNMVELAVKEYPYFDVSAIEYTRNQPSYTYDTIVKIKEIKNTDDKIYFIIGTDAFLKIESWYKSDELKKLVKFLLFVRANQFNEKPFYDLYLKGYEFMLMKMPFINISSSEIRKKIKKKENICDIVPPKVVEYINQNDLYKI